MKENNKKVEIKLSLDKDTVEFLEAEAANIKVTLVDLIHLMVQRECEYLDEDSHYLTGRRLNPRWFENKLEELSCISCNLDEELSELWLVAKNAD